MLPENVSLTGLVGDADEVHLLARSLLQAVHDHGGNTASINRLLADVKGNRDLLAALAKLVVGPIWERTGLLVDLGPIDLTEPNDREFCMAHSSVVIHSHGMIDRGGMRFDYLARKGECRYRLHHLGPKSHTFDEVLEADIGGRRVEPATWRELVAYGVGLTPEILRDCTIIAAGSRHVGERWVDGQRAPVQGTIFPTLILREGKVTLGWKGVTQRTDKEFGPDCFYLVRVYIED